MMMMMIVFSGIVLMATTNVVVVDCISHVVVENEIILWLSGARKYFYRFNLIMLRLGMRGIGVLNYQSPALSGEKHFIQHRLMEFLRGNPPVVFDVGANVGEYSLMLHQNFPHARLYSFEPQPDNYRKLASATANIPNISTFEMAVGQSSGMVKLYDRADKQGSTQATVIEGVIPEVFGSTASVVEVPITSLDEFTGKHGIKEIDFLKLDIEGNELQALRGARQLIDTRSIRCIQFEFNEMNAFSGSFIRDFRALLPDYSLYRLLPRDLLPLSNDIHCTEIFAYQNIVALPSS